MKTKTRKTNIQIIPKAINILTSEQKQLFKEYIPDKVYKTERNIAILVALTQLCMIFLFLFNARLSIQNLRTVGYFSLYIFLLSITCIAIVLYRYLVKNKKYKAFLWIRRIYAFLLCSWVMGITFLEQMGGNGLGVYCYLIPTMAALLLLTPLESLVIFGGTWLGLIYMFLEISPSKTNIFSNTVNSVFVMVLALFISNRYYRSMATEFCDREIISRQYEEIQKSNALLQNMAHMDKLTDLYNRHYLLENVYPMFDECREKEYQGLFLMMDIDYFKQYNDLNGHIQGDECLRKIAGGIKELCMQEDAFAIRYGGEEFLVIKMTKGSYDADGFADRALACIQKADISRDDVVQKRVTVSAGLWQDSLCSVEHIEMAIKYADDALYQAKHSGRNRIVRADKKE